MKTIQKLAVAAVAIVTMTACCQNDKPKFDAKEYAKHKTERIDKIVELTDAQEKEVYALYLAQGKEMKKNFKAAQKEWGDVKRPDCAPKPECGKPCPKKAECKKAECDKPCPKKAECKKAECDKPCPKKAECKKAECDKPCPKKAECKKAECDKPCPKKAECGKPCAPKPECGKPMHRPHRHRPSLISPEARKATVEKLNSILTPEQSAKLKEHRTRRHACNPNGKQCVPTPAVEK